MTYQILVFKQSVIIVNTELNGKKLQFLTIEDSYNVQKHIFKQVKCQECPDECYMSTTDGLSDKYANIQ